MSTIPQTPEARTHSEYELGRDEALPLSALAIQRPHVIRFRAEQPTTEVFAHDKMSVPMKVYDLGRFSVVQVRVRDFSDVKNSHYGVNKAGVVFEHDPTTNDPPTDEELEFVPYPIERGYFVNHDDELVNGGNTVTEAVELEAGEVIRLRNQVFG